jgi:hypothetical protein
VVDERADTRAQVLLQIVEYFRGLVVRLGRRVRHVIGLPAPRLRARPLPSAHLGGAGGPTSFLLVGRSWMSALGPNRAAALHDWNWPTVAGRGTVERVPKRSFLALNQDFADACLLRHRRCDQSRTKDSIPTEAFSSCLNATAKLLPAVRGLWPLRTRDQHHYDS